MFVEYYIGRCVFRILRQKVPRSCPRGSHRKKHRPENPTPRVLQSSFPPVARCPLVTGEPCRSPPQRSWLGSLPAAHQPRPPPLAWVEPFFPHFYPPHPSELKANAQPSRSDSNLIFSAYPSPHKNATSSKSDFPYKAAE